MPSFVSPRVAEVTTVADGKVITLTGQRGELLKVVALRESIFRVTHLPTGSPRLNRTWSVVGDDTAMPRSGRARHELTNAFPDAPVGTAICDEGVVSLATTKLRVELRAVPGEHVALRWVSVEHGCQFAADRPRGAYMYDARPGGTLLRHCELKEFDPRRSFSHSVA